MSFWAKLKLAFSNVWDFLTPFFKSFATSVGQVILQEAYKAVIMVATDPTLLKDGDKQKAAFDKIKANLIAAGISASTSMINGAIEAALAKAKSEGKI